jgi:hypothetical protein
MESALKKKFKGFPMFSRLKIFKTALMGDIKQWPSHHSNRRRRCAVFSAMLMSKTK